VIAPQTQRDILHFFGAPTRGAAVALFRIAYGTLAVWTALHHLLNTDRYFGPRGMIPSELACPMAWTDLTPFCWLPDATWIAWAHTILFLLASLALLAGLAPRWAALVIYLVNLSLQHRNPFIVNGGDRLFLVLAAFCVFLPLHGRISLPPKWEGSAKGGENPLPPKGGGSGRGAPTHTKWVLRLVQIQIAYVYLESAAKKLTEPRWQEGRALYDVLASPLFAEWPTWIDSRIVVAALTWGTLVFELGFPFVVFSPYRLWAIAAGILFHLGIHVLMVLPMFSAVMIVSYALFLEDEDVDRLLARLRWRGASTQPGPKIPPRRRRRAGVRPKSTEIVRDAPT
jgi:uncharacterized membrane protein YphA (DoxX/SURF4 family)